MFSRIPKLMHGAGGAFLFALMLLSATDVTAAKRTTPPRNPPTLNGSLLLGVFSGGYNPANADAFETWLGRRSNFNVDFFSDQAYTGSNTMLSSGQWDISVWVGDNRPDRNMLFSIPLATAQDKSLAHVAAGQYDSQYQQLAASMARHYPNAIVRLGWEFNGSWYAWSAAGRTSDYINAFRHVAKIFIAASPNFTIDWCVAIGDQSMPAEQAYPGDDVVDVIGMDAYDNFSYNTTLTDPVKRWSWFRDQSHGLNWQLHFAAAHGKHASFPEWAVNSDDSYFIQQMYSWMLSNHYAYAAYWDSNSDFKGDLQDNQYPHVSATYQALFAPLP